MSVQAKSSHPIVPAKTYFIVSVVLVLLTVVAIVVSQLNWGGFGTAIVIGAAVMNAALVAGFFMHLRYDNKFFAGIFIVSLIALGFLLAFILIDTNSRQGMYDYTMQEIKRGANLKEVKQRNEARDKPASPAKK
ncbi:MAG: cytochrome C oxidase subunit IV family protein [Chloroherpetonaceae bacterium]|nr:cytochrome C oxidase subunit IV family protein [Chloroherpetonaceae bacterium]MCS7211094.1 cytochrome C oxidase subunit IV family protein [Chloroherpetonaceae bacterium]MDW8020654.1 cytochrome C oxidase subunit IV family protein [Chloroherpetonaceae bacterium]MDW8466565.1 cytochrome C oxidase subunit IV family protein [Chloroherpetonaceae bacterium]